MTTDKTIKSKNPPKQTNVTWVDLSGEIPIEKHFINGRWVTISSGGNAPDLSQYQKKLVAGENITIDNETNTISATSDEEQEPIAIGLELRDYNYIDFCDVVTFAVAEAYQSGRRVILDPSLAASGTNAGTTTGGSSSSEVPIPVINPNPISGGGTTHQRYELTELDWAVVSGAYPNRAFSRIVFGMIGWELEGETYVFKDYGAQGGAAPDLSAYATKEWANARWRKLGVFDTLLEAKAANPNAHEGDLVLVRDGGTDGLCDVYRRTADEWELPESFVPMEHLKSSGGNGAGINTGIHIDGTLTIEIEARTADHGKCILFSSQGNERLFSLLIKKVVDDNGDAISSALFYRGKDILLYDEGWFPFDADAGLRQRYTVGYAEGNFAGTSTNDITNENGLSLRHFKQARNFVTDPMGVYNPTTTLHLMHSSIWFNDGIRESIIYYCKVWRGPHLVRHFVPAKTMHANKIVAYELVEGKVYLPYGVDGAEGVFYGGQQQAAKTTWAATGERVAESGWMEG